MVDHFSNPLNLAEMWGGAFASFTGKNGGTAKNRRRGEPFAGGMRISRMKVNPNKLFKEYFCEIKMCPETKQSAIALLTVKLIMECETKDLKYLNLKWIAGKMKVSPSYVTRCYKKLFNHTPHHRLLRRKMTLAKELLVNRPKLPVKRVARRLDFSSVNYFIAVFTREVKVPPHQYRKNTLFVEARERELRKLTRRIQRSINKTIDEETNGKYKNAVYVHGGMGDYEKRYGKMHFFAPGYKTDWYGRVLVKGEIDKKFPKRRRSGSKK